jgi:ribosomal protein L32E
MKSVKYKSPSSFKTLYPFGYNEFRAKVMKEETFVSSIDDKEEFIYGMQRII